MDCISRRSSGEWCRVTSQCIRPDVGSREEMPAGRIIRILYITFPVQQVGWPGMVGIWILQFYNHKMWIMSLQTLHLFLFARWPKRCQTPVSARPQKTNRSGNHNQTNLLIQLAVRPSTFGHVKWKQMAHLPHPETKRWQTLSLLTASKVALPCTSMAPMRTRNMDLDLISTRRLVKHYKQKDLEV